jgi:IBR domain, a half RING-finger domain
MSSPVRTLPPPPSPPPSPRASGGRLPGPSSCRAVGKDEVSATRRALVVQLVAVLGGTPAEAEAQLRAAAWDLNAAVLAALDRDPPGTAPASAPASASNSLSALPGTATAASPSDSPQKTGWKRPREESVCCAVCFSDTDGPTAAYGTDCGGVLCDECWRGYARSVISSSVGASAALVICPMPSCRSVVPGALVKSVLLRDGPCCGGQSAADDKSDAELLAKFEKFQVDEFVDGSSIYRNCPAPDCEGIVSRGDSDETEVACACGHQFCWWCLFEPHYPLPCDHAKGWIVETSNDAKSRFWIVTNTKACPRCHVAINKNGGCPHMICMKCLYSFTWGDTTDDGRRSGRVQLASETATNAWAKDAAYRHRTSEFMRITTRIPMLATEMAHAEKQLRARFGDDDIDEAKAEIVSSMHLLRWTNIACAICDSASSYGASTNTATQLVDHNITMLKTLTNTLQDMLVSCDCITSPPDAISHQTSLVAGYRRTLRTVAEELV